MRIDKLILTGIMVGICSGILDGLGQEYALNSYLASALMTTILTITTGYLLHRTERNNNNKKLCVKVMQKKRSIYVKKTVNTPLF
ncbi:hypothetical protein [Mesobacillus maritimus]|uniref:hypothetical protein n=1 Tax=Mesobacillus maritimus TaxID=1643336 RepID=UPI0038503CE1